MQQLCAIVDTDRYPIDRPESSAYLALVEHGRAMLRDRSVFSLPGFVRPAALADMQHEARGLVPAGCHNKRLRDAIERDKPYPTPVSVSCIGLDQMHTSSAMRAVFYADELTNFIGALLDRAPYYRSTDPMASCMVTALDVDDELGWHFDSNDGVVTLMLEHCEAGGLFEYVSGARGLSDSQFEEILDDKSTSVERLKHVAGALTLFNGHDALHRVSPVVAGPPRLTLIFSYDSEPDQVFSETVRMGFFGRLEPMEDRP